MWDSAGKHRSGISGRMSPSRPHASPHPEESLLRSLEPLEVYQALGTTSGGLTDAEVLLRVDEYGPNRIEEVPGASLVQELLGQFVHLFALLLWAGSVLALLAGQPELCAAIVAVIVINGIFGLWQERRAERAVEALKRLLPEITTVVREGREQEILAADLLPGDVLVLSEGDRVSADARLVEAAEIGRASCRERVCNDV